MMFSNEKLTLLIVEDVSADIDILNHILQRHYTLLIAKTGEAAVRMAAEQKPDLILLDIILPDMTGFAVLTALKKSDETRQIPVIVITAVNDTQYEEKGLSLGAVDYITKPFHNTVVLARIKTHMHILRYVRAIEHLGLVDTLTGLPNRRSFDDRLGVEWGRALRDGTGLSLLMIDVDQFQSFNETNGYPHGDILLLEIAKEICRTLKRPADLATRLENDRFAVLLPNTDKEGAVLIGNEIRTGVEALVVPHIDDQRPLSATVGVGVAFASPDAEHSCDALIARAEEKLREAKETGRNRVCS